MVVIVVLCVANPLTRNLEEVMFTMARKSRFKVEDNGEITIVSFLNKKILDKETITEIGEDLFSLVDQYDRKKILLNFGSVEFMNAAFLNKLVVLNKKVQDKGGGKLVMCSINDDIYEVFEITKLNRLFDIQKDEQTALAEFAK